ncbi:MAG TPA: Uma2 family endonuclease [Kofleriaceae bacterium]|jgi:Uma2 family endonuclease|nr:Uma2 family endonuclease [Kofleriaceae bacterium]
MVTPAHRPKATVADLEAYQGTHHAELIGGTIVEKALPGGDHALAQAEIILQVAGAFHRGRGGGQPGGWWILPEMAVELGPDEVYLPDIAGWRRERVPERPRGTRTRIVPDWVCEVLSDSNARNDLVDKLRVYQRREVGHYWIVDPMSETLTVYRLQHGEYTLALTAKRGERVRAEPFAEIELDVGALFGDEPG